MSSKKSDYNCVIVLGPTAVGKTSIGVAIAHHFDGEIISADSRQTYRHLDIGSGKDLDEYTVDGKPIPYHLIDIIDLPDEYTVYNYPESISLTHPVTLTSQLKLSVHSVSLTVL